MQTGTESFKSVHTAISYLNNVMSYKVYFTCTSNWKRKQNNMINLNVKVAHHNIFPVSNLKDIHEQESIEEHLY